jgi:hypothetical protein
MTETPDPIVATATRLCDTLDRLGDALVTLDADTLLETEATLAQLTAALAAGHPVHDRDGLEAMVRRAATALLRCRRLGASYTSIAGTRLRMIAGAQTYGPTGGYVETAYAGSAVKVTT